MPRVLLTASPHIARNFEARVVEVRKVRARRAKLILEGRGRIVLEYIRVRASRISTKIPCLRRSQPKASCNMRACILLAILAGCASVSVKYDYDKEVDFQAYRTYAWAENEIPDDELAKNPLMKKRVQMAVNETLRSKGYSMSEPDQADFMVVTHAGIKERMRIQDYGRYGWYDPWWGPYGGRVDVSYYEEGTLVIDIVDAGEKELVWRGMGTGIVNKHARPEKMQQNIDKDVTKILAAFPPGQ